MLKSLGVAGDTAADVKLLESLDDLVTEIVDDIYLAHFGRQRRRPGADLQQACELARAVVNDPCDRAAARTTRNPDQRGSGPAAVCRKVVKPSSSAASAGWASSATTTC